MKRAWITLLLIINVLLSGFTLQQDEHIKITRMQVKIWPEYDRSEVLVITRLKLAEDTTLPIQVSFRIPRDAGAPYKIAMIDLDGQLYNLEYTLVPEGIWNRVVFTTSSLELQIEYYDPRMQIVQNQHLFQYSWIGDYPVESLLVSVQQPRNSTNFTISPYFGVGQVNPDDKLVYYSKDMGAVDKGITINLEIQYNKKTTELSASNLPVIAATPIAENRGLQEDILSVVEPVLDNKSLIIAGSLIFGSLVFFLLVSMIAGDRLIFSGEFFRRKKSSAEKPAEDDQVEIFCSHCGKSAKRGDRYCRVCGSQL